MNRLLCSNARSTAAEPPRVPTSLPVRVLPSPVPVRPSGDQRAQTSVQLSALRMPNQVHHFTVEGIPRNTEGARDLWRRDKYHFQKWAVEQVDGFVTTRRTADGGIDPAQAWILGVRTDLNSKKPDPVYHDAVKATWSRLKQRAKDGTVALTNLVWKEITDDETVAPRQQAPLLLKTHLDAWCQTNPLPPIQPDVASFLHGMDQQASADVSLVWRWDRTNDALQLVPPRQAEFLQVPIGAARAWLSGMEPVDFADVDWGNNTEFDDDGTTDIDCWRWEGFGQDATEIKNVRDIRPGDILLVHPEMGGIRSGTWDPESNTIVSDFGDHAQWEHGRRGTLRLNPQLSYIEGPPLPDQDEEATESTEERIRMWLDQIREQKIETKDWLARTAGKLSRNFRCDRVVSGSGKYYILSQTYKSQHQAATGKPKVDSETWDGSDRANSLIGTGIPLEYHLKGVAKRATRFAERLGLPRELREDIYLAARLHDIGKVDPRFQSLMVGGDPVELAMREEPLAKSVPGAKRVRTNTRVPRHEIMSVAILDSAPDVLAGVHDQDLVLHLISTHHGWGRPLLPIEADEDPQELAYPFQGRILSSATDQSEGSLALDMADRFWRLIERYGYHGLAWLESILRLADHRQSEVEAEE